MVMRADTMQQAVDESSTCLSLGREGGNYL